MAIESTTTSRRALKRESSHTRRGVDAAGPKELKKRVRKLERLVEIISRGKYQWESTFDAITSPVQIVKTDYIIERANVAFAEHGGMDITEIPGKVCSEVLANRDAPCEGCPLRTAVGQDSRHSAALGHRARRREFEASAYPLVLRGDGPDGAVMSYRDITEERRLQQEVIQQEKMAAIGILAGGVAHEINNPLGGILAFTQLLLRDAKDQANDDLAADLREIENAAVRCKKIVSDLLDFSRFSKDKEVVDVEVNQLLQNVLPFIRSEIKSLNVDLDVKVGKDLPIIRGIPDRLQQVFLNLMTNACHAMPKGGTLSIETRPSRDRSRVMVVVRDTGEGMPSSVRDKIFDPFFTTKQPGKGTGLGLSISYRIVKEHEGSIEVESRMGKGTTFTVTLPAARQVRKAWR
jgi:signal transduction histidine kinase